MRALLLLYFTLLYCLYNRFKREHLLYLTLKGLGTLLHFLPHLHSHTHSVLLITEQQVGFKLNLNQESFHFFLVGSYPLAPQGIIYLCLAPN